MTVPVLLSQMEADNETPRGSGTGSGSCFGVRVMAIFLGCEEPGAECDDRSIRIVSGDRDAGARRESPAPPGARNHGVPPPGARERDVMALDLDPAVNRSTDQPNTGLSIIWPDC